MKCKATIIVEVDADRLHECMEPELIDYERSSFSMKKLDGRLQFDITAKDAVALRATINAIITKIGNSDRLTQPAGLTNKDGTKSGV